MFFYVDESGHTGTNLFDEIQPVLYYGVLSSKTSLDHNLQSKKHVSSLKKRLSVNRLHATELGNDGIASIVPDILTLQKKFNLRFDIYRVVKVDHAVVCFFDQAFDQGVNPAVPWASYWTPLRYILLLKLATLFDERSLKKTSKLRQATIVLACN